MKSLRGRPGRRRIDCGFPPLVKISVEPPCVKMPADEYDDVGDDWFVEL